MRRIKLAAYDPTPVLTSEEMAADALIEQLGTHLTYMALLQACAWPSNVKGPREHRQKMLELQRALKAVGEMREVARKDGTKMPMRMLPAKGATIEVRNESLWELLKKSVETFFSEAGVDLEQAELVQTVLDDVKQEVDEDKSAVDHQNQRKLRLGRGGR